MPGEEGVERGVSGVLPNPFRTSRSEEVRELPAEDIGRLETGVATLLGRPGPPGAGPGGEAGSPAFLARSLRAAAKVDLELAGAGLGPVRPG